jgi:hypothetical protein
VIGTSTWLAATRELQTQMGNLPFGHERERTQFLKDMMLAAHVELDEALQRIDWKPWRSDRVTDRAGFVEEMVDVLHFCGNLLVAFDVTDDELHEAYTAKHRVVRQRQLDTR